MLWSWWVIGGSVSLGEVGYEEGSLHLRYVGTRYSTR